jgi:hypothetical protein
MKYKNELIDFIQQDDLLMAQLKRVESLGIPQCCIGAGAIRNLVWDKLHHYDRRTPLADIDVVYFDDELLTEQQENNYLSMLRFFDSEVNWEVVNQARVHCWYERKFHIQVQPLTSLEDGISTWPETATCVGAYLSHGTVKIIAPFGLTDLFELKIRHNPVRMNKVEFFERQHQKQWQSLWPKLMFGKSLKIESNRRPPEFTIEPQF